MSPYMWRRAQVWIQIPQKVFRCPPLNPLSFQGRHLSTMGAIGQHKVNTTERLAGLRALMKKEDVNVQAFVVPSEDQHSSEYLASCDKRRAFISGFSGSAGEISVVFKKAGYPAHAQLEICPGCAIITLDKAFLFTDGRYFLQAEKQLDENWTLMKQGLPGFSFLLDDSFGKTLTAKFIDVPSWQEFLYKNLEPSTKIGIDATLISASDAESLSKELSSKSSKLISLSQNPVDAIWEDRPTRPASSVFHLAEKYSGQSYADKIVRVREELEKKKAKATVVTMLDEVAWLFNLRGSDINFNPVFFAYAVITMDKAVLFIRQGQLNEAARQYLGDHVDIRPYDSFFDYLKGLAGTLDLGTDSKIVIGDNASLAVANALGEGTYTTGRSPVTDLKAIKNATELEGFRQSHIRDGAALARYFSWLEEQLNKGVELNESQGSDQLAKFRSELDMFQGISFTTISSTGPNGAIIHYSPDPNDCDIIKKDQIYLCDSGGQFLDGTTDVTRTWHFGTPTQEEKRVFTRVLQGHISIDSAIFPTGTTGYVIDSFARRALWQDGLDYRHGTGHGVGHYLSIHEGPHGIGTRIAYNASPLKAGMTVSNEPGYYADGKFGVRIESIVFVREVKTPNNFGDKGYLGFEHITMCPIQTKLVDVTLLSEGEKNWLNEYHAETLGKVSPLLVNDSRALEWLKRECAPL